MPIIITSPVTPPAPPEDPEAWEEVYGPDYPLMPGDVPVLQNGLCRVHWVAATSSFGLSAYVAAEDDYVEQARITLWWRESSTDTEIQYTTLISAQVVEWTPERAVVFAVLGIGSSDRCEVYLTLQRGWTGPRVEAYGRWDSPGKPEVAIRLVPFAAGATTLGRSSGTVAITNGTNRGTFAALEPWAYLLGQTPNLALHVAVLQAAAKIIDRTTAAAYGSNRDGISIAAPDSGASEGYISATLGTGPRGSAAADAQQLGQANLIDARSIPELLPR